MQSACSSTLAQKGLVTMQIFVNALPWILCIIINLFLLTQWIAGRRVGVGDMYIAVYDKHVKLGDQPPLALAIISFLSIC